MTEMENEEFVKIGILENMIEAQVLEPVLKEQNIPYRIRSYHDTAYDGLFQVQKGWGDLYAPESCKQDILDILHEIRTEQPDSDTFNE